MDNIKNDIYYVKKIYSDISFLIKHTKNISAETFGSDELLIDSIMFRFIQISESIKKLSEHFKVENQHIPWVNIIGLRNRIIHDYGKVDLSVIYDTVKLDIYELDRLFLKIIKNHKDQK